MRVLLPDHIQACLLPSSQDTVGYKESDDLNDYKNEFDCIVTYPIDGAKLSLIEHFTKAKEFIIIGSGEENIDYDYAKTQGTEIIRLTGINESAVLEWLTFHYLLFKRQFDVYGMTTKPGTNFLKEKYLRTIPIIKGLGFIGFGKIANSFLKSIELVHTQVYYYDPYVTSDIGVKAESINDVFKNCELVIVSVPLTTETTNLISADDLKDVKHKVSMLSISRYELINWESLKSVSHQLGFNAMDCLPDEYLITKKNTKINDNSMFQASRKIPILATPHIASRTIETSLKIAAELHGHFEGNWNARNYTNVQDYLKSRTFNELQELNKELHKQTASDSVPDARDKARIRLEGIINEQTKLSTYKAKND